MKYLILTFILLLSFNANAAPTCNFSDIKLGSNYLDIKSTNNIHYDFDNAELPDYFEVQSRARNFCDTLDGTIEANLTFISGKLAQVIFRNYATQEILKPITIDSFGEVEEKTIANKYGNNDMLAWNKDDANITYARRTNVKREANDPENNWPFETVTLSLNEYSTTISEHSVKREE